LVDVQQKLADRCYMEASAQQMTTTPRLPGIRGKAGGDASPLVGACREGLGARHGSADLGGMLVAVSCFAELMATHSGAGREAGEMIVVTALAATWREQTRQRRRREGSSEGANQKVGK
jgi:hypothetical protein